VRWSCSTFSLLHPEAQTFPTTRPPVSPLSQVSTPMGKHPPDNLPRAGAASAALAAAALVVLAVLPRPFAPLDHLAILAGSVRLTPEQFIAYKGYVSNNLTVDSFYLLAHSVMWAGLAQRVSRHSRRLGTLVLTSGLLGAGLDFLENELRWAAMTTLSSGNLPSASYVATWATGFGLSFWLLFIAALFTGLGVARSSRCGNLVAAWSLIGACVAASSFKAGFLPAFLWLIVWHVFCAFLLWFHPALEASRPVVPAESLDRE